MSKQPDKVFALYYNAARMNVNDTTLHLDNQTHQSPSFQKGGALK
ncbi:MAG: hypothetical protein Q4F17_10725 [Eubacteriales bacterium]|nr:hypothetical protein [Eubacteriales bacterium]